MTSYACDLRDNRQDAMTTAETTTLSPQPPRPPPRSSSSSNSSKRSSSSSFRHHFNSFAPRAPALLFLIAVAFVADIVTAESGYIGEYDKDVARRSNRIKKRRANRPARSMYSRYAGGIGQRYGRGLLRHLLEVDDGDANINAGETTSTENLRTADTGATSGAFEEEHKSDPAATCLTLLQIIETRPNLTRLAEAMSDLPVVGPWGVSRAAAFLTDPLNSVTCHFDSLKLFTKFHHICMTFINLKQRHSMRVTDEKCWLV